MKILVVLPLNGAQKERLRCAAGGAEVIFTSPRGVTAAELAAADALIGNLPPERLREAAGLRWVQLNSAGAEAYAAPGVLPEGAVLTNASGAYGLAISEHMLACLLYLMKHLDLYGADQAGHVWQDHGPVRSIWGSRTLVVGCGDIGGAFGCRMAALGSRVTGIRRTAAEKPEWLEAVYPAEHLADCLGEADVVASCLPGTAATHHLFNRQAFAQMKPGAYFLNVGRGGTVDSLALAEALREGRLAGAAVDVTEPEPLPPDHPLWKAGNILITPHVSGGYHLPETLERIVGIAADNLRRFVAGEALCNVVDAVTGYRRRQDQARQEEAE